MLRFSFSVVCANSSAVETYQHIRLLFTDKNDCPLFTDMLVYKGSKCHSHAY